ncbi:methenyltetrahydrofolate synthetase [Megachile rotundata]|uniref:methenyltetrahydrofolate synthetase n=1 Tax=Megachile rotundata TaxID=143995 RepID=UPI000614EE2C|nr:PREDICTED: 5-formyltetrahydrofolate cyclo-ligase [Megachile rotundata]
MTKCKIKKGHMSDKINKLVPHSLYKPDREGFFLRGCKDTGAMCGIRSAKLTLRKQMKYIIAQLSADEKQRQSRKVFEKLCSLKQFQESKRVSVYLSTEDEINTIPILKHMFKLNKEVFVPRYKGKQMEMVKLSSMEDYEKLPLTKWCIKQPSINEIRENALETGGLDLILLPGVAFTVTGKRLGHGMGYYDRFLEKCIKNQEKRPHMIAVAFNEQLREDIPISESDVLLDLVLTEKSA